MDCVYIDLKTQPMFNGPPPNFTPLERKTFDEWFVEANAKGWIQRSHAKHSCSPMFVPKKNGKLRLCINYRRLNDITKTRVYAPSTALYMKQLIARHQWYSKIDLRDAFHRLKINPSDTWKTAFRTPYGLHEFRVLPFGLTNAPLLTCYIWCKQNH